MDADAEAEALRQRLYLPGATAADLAAYRAALPALPAPPAPAAHDDAASAGPPPGRSPRLTRRRLLAAGAVLLGGAAAGTAVALSRPPAVVPERPAAGARDVDSTVLRLDGADRGELIDNLARGGAAGIGAYLLTHPSPPGLAGASRVVTAERFGAGSGSVALDEDGIGGDAGRATVLVVSAGGSAIAWTAQRLGTRGSPVVRLVTVASGRGADGAGELTAATVRYAAGARPVRLAVRAPAGERWGAAVVFSD